MVLSCRSPLSTHTAITLLKIRLRCYSWTVLYLCLVLHFKEIWSHLPFLSSVVKSLLLNVHSVVFTIYFTKIRNIVDSLLLHRFTAASVPLPLNILLHNKLQLCLLCDGFVCISWHDALLYFLTFDVLLMISHSHFDLI